MIPVAAAGRLLDDGARVSRRDRAHGHRQRCRTTVYFVLLQRGYESGDLSLVYPLARGTGPILATAGAIAILGERPGPLALAGTAAIAVGVVLLLATRGISRGPALAYALLTGLLIGIYTIWDGHAVRGSHAEPLFYLLVTNLTIVALLLPAALRERATVRCCAGPPARRRGRRPALAVRLRARALRDPDRRRRVRGPGARSLDPDRRRDRDALLQGARRLAEDRRCCGHRRRSDRARARLS